MEVEDRQNPEIIRLKQRLVELQENLHRVDDALEESNQRALTATPVDEYGLQQGAKRLHQETKRLTQQIEKVERQLLSLRKQDLLDCAHSSERNSALVEALASWRQLLALDATNVEAKESVTRIEVALERQRGVHELVDRLTHYFSRHPSDMKFCASVIRTLRSPHLSTAKTLPEFAFVESLLADQLTLDQFKEAWAELSAPAPAGSAPDVDFRALWGRLVRGELVVVLGAILQPPDQLADALAGLNGALLEARQQRSSSPSELAEYIEMRREYGPLGLIHKVSAILPRDAAGARLFSLLARIERPLFIISTSHDQLLERAFAEEQKKHVVVSTVIDGTGELPAGQLIIKYSDADNVKPPMSSEALSHERPLEAGYSVLFKARGTCDDQAEPSDPIHRTFTLSEARHFAFARRFDKLIPDYIASNFSGRGLLVLGYQPVFWEDRLVLNTIIDRYSSFARERATVVTMERDGFTGAYWISRGVSQYSYTLEDFVARLERAAT